MKTHRIYSTSFASVYPHYIAKAEKKGRTKNEVDEIIRWLTGYTQRELESQIKCGSDFETFFAHASTLNPLRQHVTGVVCGVRIEDIKDPLMREIRILDKLIDELARGKSMEKILRRFSEEEVKKTSRSESNDLPKLSAPATRALESLKISTLAQLIKYSADELLGLHGFGPSALQIIQRELQLRKLSLRSNEVAD
jgi:hypothetical protein